MDDNSTVREIMKKCNFKSFTIYIRNYYNEYWVSQKKATRLFESSEKTNSLISLILTFFFIVDALT